MPLRTLILTLLVVAFFVGGCRSTLRSTAPLPGLPEAYPNHTIEQVEAYLRPPAADTLLTFRAKASLALRTPDQSATVTADLRQRRGDSLYMSVSPGLGIEAARLLVTPDSFFVYDRIKKRLTYGALADAEESLPALLAGDDAFLMLLGLAPPEASVVWEMTADSSYYILSDPERDRYYVINPTVWRVARYVERDSDGDLVEERIFDEYDLFDGIYLPRRVMLRRPQDDTRATLYYRDLDLNPDAVSFPFRVGDDVDRVPVRGTQDAP